MNFCDCFAFFLEKREENGKVLGGDYIFLFCLNFSIFYNPVLITNNLFRLEGKRFVILLKSRNVF